MQADTLGFYVFATWHGLGGYIFLREYRLRWKLVVAFDGIETMQFEVGRAFSAVDVEQVKLFFGSKRLPRG
jgi:hypothetical protein